MSEVEDGIYKYLENSKCKYHTYPSMDNPHGCTDCYNAGIILDSEEVWLLFYAHKEIVNLKAQIEQYQNGYKGACQCCEPVGELNVKLKAQVEMLEEGIEYCIKLFSQLKDMSNREELLLNIEEKLKQMRGSE